MSFTKKKIKEEKKKEEKGSTGTFEDKSGGRSD